MALFDATIDGWESWWRVFHSTAHFAPLVSTILARHRLTVEPVRPLTPGTHAVFATSTCVVKIYAPIESGLDSTRDVTTEIAAMRLAAARGLHVPTVLASGMLEDKYLFRYLIMERIQGREIGALLPSLSSDPLNSQIQAIHDCLRNLHQPADGEIEWIDLRTRAIDNPRLDRLSTGLCADLAALAQEQPLDDLVFVHGDLTGENLLLADDNRLVFIDFADAVLAPVCYELPSLVFDLLQADRRCVRELALHRDPDEFVEEVLRGLAIHDFTGNLLGDFFARLAIAPASVDNIAALRSLLRSTWFAG